MKRSGKTAFLILLALAALLFSCTANAQEDNNPGESVMTDNFLEGNTSAPEFPRNLDWLNADTPLSIKQLRGKIVLLDFWTFCCINCMHVIPDLKKLEHKYADELVVIGVHSAKFANEKGSEAIRQAILRYGLEHPVVNDKDFAIWSLYGVHAWPSFVLINPNGKIIGVHSGEGIYEPFDKIIGDAVKYFSARGELKSGPLNLALERESMPNTLLSFPGKVKADTIKKRLFITDSNNDRIIIADTEGNILDVIGSGKQGQEDGSFEEASFFHPQGICVDGDILYIADTENHLIRKANLKDRTVETILGCGKQASSYNISGKRTGVCLNSPWDVVKQGDKLYIAMAGSHQLWVADLNSLEAKPYAGSAREARIDGPLAKAALAQPSGITSDGKKLYFADSETSSIRSADLDPRGEVNTIIGEDLFEYGDIDGDIHHARLQHPLGIVYHDGLLYIADTYNSKIKVIDPEKQTSKTYAGTGKSGYKDDNLVHSEFFEPSGLTFLNDKIYVADANNHSIRTIDTRTGTVSTYAFKNPDRLMPASMADDEFSGRLIELPLQKIAAGEGTIELKLHLPEGCKYIEGAPLTLNYSADDPSLIEFKIPSEDFKFEPNHKPVEIPAVIHQGMTNLNLNAVVYFCSEKSGVCMVENLKIKAPVKINNTGAKKLSIDVDVVANM